MRLTLRTLLAYMDDILDPADHEELQQKIEASDFATELIHRSRDAVRRLRLGAPEIDAGDNEEVLGGDPSLDANAVAEYLDNTMPPEQVAEFERCCLENGNLADMRLAEVASCHHILTMVLGEPADVRPEVRGRMYQLGAEATGVASGGEKLRIEPAHTSGSNDSSAATPATAPPVAAVADEHPEDVPDYLRAAARQEQRKRNLQLAAIAAVLIVGVAIGYFARPVADPDLSVVDPAVSGDVEAIVSGPQLQEDDAPPAGSTVDKPTSPPVTGKDAEEAPAWNPGSPEEETPSSATTGSSPEATETPATGPTPDFDAAVAADAASEAPVDTTPEDPAVVELPTDATADPAAGDYREESEERMLPVDEQGNIVFETPDFTEASDLSSEVSPPPAPSPLAGQAPSEAAEPAVAAEPSDDAAEPRLASRPDTTPSEPAPPGSDAEAPLLGEYQGNDDLLLIGDPSGEGWVRLPSQTKLAAGDRLLALPMFRAHISLDGVDAYLIDGTQVVLAPAEVDAQEADATLELLYGRLLISADLDGSRVAVKIGETVHDLELSASADLAIEVERQFVPGALTAGTGPLEVSWYLTSGKLGDGESAAQAPATWETVDGNSTEPVAYDELPDWIDQQRLSTYEREARRAVADALSPGESVGIPLLELSDKRGLGRRREWRTLAARSGAYVGIFEPFVNGLNDPDLNQLVWESQIETVRQALARDPQAAEQLRSDFVAQRGEQAATDLMEMMIGYDEQAVGTTPEERKEGILPQLIRWLDSDQLDYRVLALYNLNEITGTRNQGNYRPTHTPQQRQRALRIYWDRLEKGELEPRGR